MHHIILSGSLWLPSNNFCYNIIFSAISKYFLKFLRAKSHQNTLEIAPISKIILESPNPPKGDMATKIFF